MIENEYLIAESLDIEFEYPEDYKKFLKEMQVLDETSWWLLGYNKGLSKTCYEVLNLDYKSTKLLIPFAKSEESKILACFDSKHRVWLTSSRGNDITHANWEERFSLPTFSAWLKRVLSSDL